MLLKCSKNVPKLYFRVKTLEYAKIPRRKGPPMKIVSKKATAN